MRVLVTGRAGQLARSLEQRVPEGVELLFAARPETDLRVPGALARAVREIRPDVLLNAAAYTAVDQAEAEPKLAWRVNADAAGEGAAAARDVGAAVVQISTDYVFDGCRTVPYRENDPVAPLGVYGRSKLVGEEQVRTANPRHVILRTAWVYSPFARNFVRSMMAAAAQRSVLTVVDDQHGSPTSALDLADAIFVLLKHWSVGRQVGFGETLHVAGAGVANWCELAQAVMDQCCDLNLAAAEVRPISTAEWPTSAARPAFSALDSSHFAQLVGFAVPDWRQSLGAVVRQIAAETPE